MAEIVSNKELVSTLVKGLKDYQAEYRRIYKKDYEERKAATRPGDPVPFDDGIIRNEKYRNQAHEALQEIRAKGREVLDRALAEKKAEMMEAPSPEAVSMLTALNTIGSNLEVDDLERAFDVYGSNYIIHKALNALADSSGHKEIKRTHYLTIEENALQDLNQYVSHITLLNAEQGGADDGHIQFYIHDIESKWGAADESEEDNVQ